MMRDKPLYKYSSARIRDTHVTKTDTNNMDVELEPPPPPIISNITLTNVAEDSPPEPPPPMNIDWNAPTSACTNEDAEAISEKLQNCRKILRNAVNIAHSKDPDPIAEKLKQNQLYMNPDPDDVISIPDDKSDSDSDSSSSLSSETETETKKTLSKITKEDEALMEQMGRHQKRRFKNAMDAGFFRNEALKISQEPLLFVGFLSACPESHVLDKSHMWQVREAISKTEDILKYKAEIVTFYHERGWLKIACTSTTADWLRKNIEYIQNITELNIKLVGESNFPSTLTIRGNFLDSLSYSNAKILALIKAENSDLDTSLWKLVKRKAQPNAEHIVVTFEIDSVSWSKLLKSAAIISYRFRKIKLEMKETPNNAKRLKKTTTTTFQSSNATPPQVIPATFAQVHAIRGLFPHSQKFSNSEILSFIEAQNKVNISLWKVAERKKDEFLNEQEQIILEIDHDSWSKLKQADGYIFYRFGQIKFDLTFRDPSKYWIRGIFPQNYGCSAQKMLAVIKAQNDLDVSQWKMEERHAEDLYFTFEIDENSWHKLSGECKSIIFYAFEQIKLEMLESKANPVAFAPAIFLVRGEFSYSVGDGGLNSEEKVLSLIKTQNEINVSLWKPLPRSDEDSPVYTFEVDTGSWYKLRKQNGKIHYGYGQIELELFKKQNDQMVKIPYNKICRRLVQGKFPESKEYAEDKVLPLIKIQNDLDISLWKPLPRKTCDSNFLFEIDEGSWLKLQQSDGRISFGFGHIQLNFLTDDKENVPTANTVRDTSCKRIVRGSFPGSTEATDPKEILSLIKTQNDFDVSAWKPLEHSKDDRRFSFEVDMDSWQKLKRQNGRISYRFGEIKLKLVEERLKRQNDETVVPPLIVQGSFPRSSEYTAKQVLNFIRIQNDLDVKLWNPQPKLRKDTIFSFGVDRNSWQKLKKRGGFISYRFDQVKLKFIRNESSSFHSDDDDYSDDDDLYEESYKQFFVSGNFAHSRGYDADKILDLISAQNRISVRKWDPIPEKSDGCNFTFEVNEHSWSLLKRRNGVITYKYGKMKLDLTTESVKRRKATPPPPSPPPIAPSTSYTAVSNRGGMDDLKSKIASCYELIESRSSPTNTDNDNDKPHDGSDSLSKLAELKKKIATRYDKMQNKFL